MKSLKRHGARFACWLADAFRGVSACVFPFFVWLVWIGILAGGQGEDVVRRATERAALDESWSDLLALAMSSILLGLSLWYAMRSLLSVQQPGLPPPAPGRNGPAAWVPRLFGASAVAWPGAVILMALPRSPQESTAAGTADTIRAAGHLGFAVFLALALALLVLLWRRMPLLGLPHASGPRPLRRDEALPAPLLRTIFWGIALMTLCALLVLVLPLSVTRVVGSASLIALALACINVFGSFALTFLPLRKGLPLLAPWAAVFAVAISPWSDNHGPQPGSLNHRAIAAAARPGVAEAYKAWLAHRGNGNEPVYVVATEGGGIRAGYWTAAVLERLSADPDRHFAQNLFAISSVSGGSVGAGFWVAGERSRQCAAAAHPARADVATRALTTDFLSSTVGFMLFPDLMQRFVPHAFPQANRSRGLEESWERAFDTVPGKPMDQSLDELYEGCPGLPELLINATVAETGQRAVLTRLSTANFVDVFVPQSGSDPSTLHQPLAGVILHSARFPVVSPAGSVVETTQPGHPLITRLIDGGYFDNSGIVTALEVIDGMRQVQDTPPIVLVVITDAMYAECPRTAPAVYCGAPTIPPAPSPRRGPVAGTAWLNEPWPILSGLFNVRDSHVHEAISRALRTVQVAIIDRSPAPGEVAAPTGWALSRSVTELIDAEAADIARRMPVTAPPWAIPVQTKVETGGSHG